MTFLYDLAFLMYGLFALPLFLAKGKWRKGFEERLGFIAPEIRERLRARTLFWVHAVSVGEARIGCLLIREIRHRLPGVVFLMTTTTASGREIARQLLAPEDLVLYYPLDLSFTVRRFLNALRPSVLVLVETELWPNLLQALKRRGIPVVIANGRISERAYWRYRLAGFFVRRFVDGVTLVLAQSPLHEDRFIRLGLKRDRVVTVGNLKFDLLQSLGPPRRDLGEIFQRWKSEPGSPVWFCSSTHAGEEEILLEVYGRLKGVFPKLKWVLAPRHVERIRTIEEILGRRQFASTRLSLLLKEGREPLSEILLVDLWGIANDCASFSDAVFVGGSLVPSGGHNIAEPAFYARAILHGPYMDNFTDMLEAFSKNQATLLVHGEEELFEALQNLLKNPAWKNGMGHRARDVVLQNQGAMHRCVERILLCLEKHLQPAGKDEPPVRFSPI